MKILVSGSTGFIGSALVEKLQQQDHTVVRLVHKKDNQPSEDYLWSPEENFVDKKAFQGCRAVVHLAAENISGRWTSEKMHKIRQSRVQGAKVICEAILSLENRPEIYLSASGVGFYGDRGNEKLLEDQPCGDDFLASVSKDREAVSDSLKEQGTRVINTRFGMVLDKTGPLSKMLGPFKAGLGAKFGDGSQYWSWIHRTDAVRAIIHSLNTESVSGPVNVTSPNPVKNAEFAKTLAAVLEKPQFLSMPPSMARLMLGKLADALLLSSIRAEPGVLIDSGFVFEYPHLEQALTAILKNKEQ